jgi:hypothetical protein
MLAGLLDLQLPREWPEAVQQTRHVRLLRLLEPVARLQRVHAVLLRAARFGDKSQDRPRHEPDWKQCCVEHPTAHRALYRLGWMCLKNAQ